MGCGVMCGDVMRGVVWCSVLYCTVLCSAMLLYAQFTPFTIPFFKDSSSLSIRMTVFWPT